MIRCNMLLDFCGSKNSFCAKRKYLILRMHDKADVAASQCPFGIEARELGKGDEVVACEIEPKAAHREVFDNGCRKRITELYVFYS